jgi:hypothetical protein
MPERPFAVGLRCNAACRLGLRRPWPASIAGGGRARPNHPISGHPVGPTLQKLNGRRVDRDQSNHAYLFVGRAEEDRSMHSGARPYSFYRRIKHRDASWLRTPMPSACHESWVHYLHYVSGSDDASEELVYVTPRPPIGYWERRV